MVAFQVNFQVNPYIAVAISTGLTTISLIVVTLLYYMLKSRINRYSDIYLSGEPESVVSMLTPSIMALYWGFIKRFAKTLYNVLIIRVHTGSLHDWYKFISSWFSLLILISIVVFTALLLTGS